MLRLALIILDQDAPDLTIACLQALATEIDPEKDRVLVIDDSPGGSSSRIIEAELDQWGWGAWAHTLREPTGGNVARGFNTGMRVIEAEHYLLLASDAVPRPGAIAELLRAAELRADAGIIGPRMEYADGSNAPSCFRDANPATEFLRAAGTGFLPPLTRWYELNIRAFEEPVEVAWMAFAAVLVRRQIFATVGALDEGCDASYEALDYARRVRDAGWKVLHWPDARFVYYRAAARRRAAQAAREEGKPKRPTAYYDARTRYFQKHFGKPGLVAANAAFTLGHAIGRARELVGRTPKRSFEHEMIEVWKSFLRKDK